MNDGIDIRRQAGPLNGWRAIANYLGRNQSTVKRWATEGGLPVHRPQGSTGRKGVPVYAFAYELDGWLKGREGETDSKGPEQLDHAEYSQPARYRFGRRALIGGALATGALLGLPILSSSLWKRTDTKSVLTIEKLSPEARQFYFDAHYLWQKRTPDSLREAEKLLLRVARLEPRFGGAQADLATVYNLMVEYGVLPPEEGYSRSRIAAERAIMLDPDSARAHSVLGDIAIFWDRDYAPGLQHLERAVALDPGDAQAHHWYASALMGLGSFGRAADEIAKAREIEPLSRSILVSSAMIQLGLGQYDHARVALIQLTINEPTYRSPYRFLSFAEFARGDYPAYLDRLNTRFTLSADKAGLAVIAAGRQALGRNGFDGMARAMLDTAQALPAEFSVEPYFLAHLFALAGKWEAAAHQLAQMLTRHPFYYGIDPAFAPARQDTRFLQIVGDARLPIIKSNP